MAVSSWFDALVNMLAPCEKSNHQVREGARCEAEARDDDGKLVAESMGTFKPAKKGWSMIITPVAPA